jgi:hypothetical protein
LNANRPPFHRWNAGVFYEKKGLHESGLSGRMIPLGRLWRRGRLIDPVKENLNTKMLKKYTKYVATAFAVASLSTFMIGCGAEVDDADTGTPDPGEGTGDEGTNSLADPAEGGGDGN